MKGEKFDPKDVEEILSRRPSSDSYKIKKSDLPEIAKSVGIGIIEIVKAIPIISFTIFSSAVTTSSKTSPLSNHDDEQDEENTSGFRCGHSGFGYYDSNDQKID